LPRAADWRWLRMMVAPQLKFENWQRRGLWGVIFLEQGLVSVTRKPLIQALRGRPVWECPFCSIEEQTSSPFFWAQRAALGWHVYNSGTADLLRNSSSKPPCMRWQLFFDGVCLIGIWTRFAGSYGRTQSMCPAPKGMARRPRGSTSAARSLLISRGVP